ncbi:Diacylglycerol O-acyltransferase 2 [Terramyces sp. JEL0728]|nr:Diacylglycerol O-acyltransferase 2 [Terramyces sp. JEL0728]
MGGRKIAWVRNWKMWSYMRDFFPMKLVKTADLDPSRNYVFGYHPHGIISLGAWVNFGTEANGFSNMFHGIDLRLLTLSSNFFAPFVRELLLSLGICSVTRQSCENILNSGPGNSLMIVVGGAQEALYAFPGTNRVLLKNRFGFIKIALRHGASLVPVYGFGENDLWDQLPNPEGSLLYSFQMAFKKLTMVTPPALHGRGIFTYNFGFLPYRRQVATVVGRPIDCPKIANPTNEQVAHYHKLYMEELEHIHREYQDEYIPNRKSDLKIV